MVVDQWEVVGGWLEWGRVVLECKGWRGRQRSCGQGFGWLPLHQGREGLGPGYCRCLLPPRLEKVAQGMSHGKTIEGLTKGMRVWGIGKKWWELQ